jgi:hypothetical protein
MEEEIKQRIAAEIIIIIIIINCNWVDTRWHKLFYANKKIMLSK